MGKWTDTSPTDWKDAECGYRTVNEGFNQPSFVSLLWNCYHEKGNEEKWWKGNVMVT